MRLTLVSLCLAFVFLLPMLAEQFYFILPLQVFLNIPATGLNYMAVMFHEMGHTLTNWLFGVPSLPSFDFENGGGMTYGFERVTFILWMVYAAAAGAAIFLFKQQGYFWLLLLGTLTALHLALAFNDGYQVLQSYMGQGGEILVACFCLWRASLGLTHYGIVERYLNMVFGLYVFGRNFIISGGLVYSDISRSAYSMQKGQHDFGDFSRIADILNISIERVSEFFIAFMLVCLSGVIYLIWQDKEKMESTSSF